ncbi:Two-component response regulator AioR; As(III) responsive; Fis family (NtrC-like) activator, sigma-54 specific (plasmid) [Pseudorhizobium banfieldiae]|uniref:AroR n=1 Tax=Pseudorhizobium banfieldiae TaxID=1125847 RepID=C6SUB8_9HYPH|nr:arsenic response regulator transcription factor AioR [Pseudorhizobium banfieldiae]ACT90638.1 AroR [Pseudorhizobium banfieldiae]CAD6631174.1 sigma-54-dependent Fis family transcriptional regulator [arsenite-oxidising bacterium NT-25]CCF22053.1 Two-component response regulator AioR; As(III) responsive; Fis family (NtrC-like) activator, sigma-54 specific [Pseudorhizobium banfieldiae]
MPHETGRIAILEDDPIMGESLHQRLSLEGHTVKWWTKGEQAVRELTDGTDAFDLVVCDIRLPDMNGEEVFRKASRDTATPFLFMSGYGDIDQAVRLMRNGAVDFITKPFDMTAFLERVSLSLRSKEQPEGTLGISLAMRNVEQVLRRYASHPLPVLIQGETGTGKEVSARFLHQISARKASPFIAVNCAAIPGDLLESELFGHEKGAFTGAHQLHRGYAERAGEGILFLDEIGDMQPTLQVKLLRLIEDGYFHRVGSEGQVPFRARIVCATHQDIGSDGSSFRKDLFFRLSTLPVRIAPLRERPEDILWLAHRFLEAIMEIRDTRVRGIGALAEDAMLEHSWPGNARELRNRLERAAALSESMLLMPADIFPEIVTAYNAPRMETLADAREAAERRQILRALSATNGQILQAARRLGISRTTLWEKMTRFGIEASGCSGN